MSEDVPKGTESHYHSKKDRVFVRAIAGHYSLKEELARLRALPRVRKGKEIKFVDGPQTYSRHYVEPKDGIAQTLHLHIEEYGPGGKSHCRIASRSLWELVRPPGDFSFHDFA